MPVAEILKTNYTGNQIQGVAELLKERELGLLDYNDIFHVVPGIKGKQKVGYVGSVEKVTRKDEGCGQEPVDITPPTRVIQWNPQPFKAVMRECYHDWFNSFLEWGLKNGIKRQDLTTDDYFLFLVDIFGDAIKKDFLRYVLFGNVNHTPVGAGTGTEVLTAGELPVDFNIIDGYYAKMFAELANDPSRRYTIAANAGADYAAQRNLAADEGFKAFTFLLDNADGRMFDNAGDLVILSTYQLAKNASRYMREEYRNEMTFTRVENGFEITQFEGVKVVTSRWLDMVIKRDFDNGTKWDLPHRAFLLDKMNNQIGIDSESSLEDIEVEYIGGMDEHTYAKAAYTADFQRPIPEFGTGAF